jgi:ketosteroid isomerase-like protein
MKNFAMVFLCLGMLAAGLFSQVEDKSPALKGLVESEKAFSQMSEAKGIREAFLTFLAQDSVVFRPKPVPGRQAYEHVAAESPVLLTWTPDYAEVSVAGDLGYTAGPYLLKRNRSDAQASAYGHYVSVWKKQEDGTWKVLLDIGISHAEPGPKVEGVESRKTKGAARLARVDQDKEARALIEEDRAFSSLSQNKGVLEAYLFYADEDIRFYRENNLPIVGKTVLPMVLTGISGEVTWNPLAAAVSASADLGYTYGISTLKAKQAEKNPAESSSYTRIWRKTADGKWQVALDIAVPIPQE